MNSTNVTSGVGGSRSISFEVPPIQIFYAAVGVFGFLGNGVSTFIFHRIRSILSRSTFILFIHQTIVDSAFSLLLTITMVTPARYEVSNLDPTSGWSKFYCEVWLANKFFWALNVCSVYNMLCLTFDRFLAIVKPLWYSFISRESAFACKVYCTILILLTWAIALASNFSITFNAVTTSGLCGYFPTPEGRIFAFYYITLKLFLPILILIIFYSQMLIHLKKHINSLDDITNGQPSNAPPAANNKVQQTKKRLFTLFVVIASLYAICFVPNQVFFFAIQIGAPVKFGSSLHVATVVLLYLNTSIYPIVYSLTLPPFRKAVMKVIGFKSSAVTTSTGSNVNNGGSGTVSQGVHN